MAEWWEEDEKIHDESPQGIWWKGTKKNASRGCPDVLRDLMGLGVGSYGIASKADESIGLKTSLKILRGAGQRPDFKLAGTTLAFAWCAGSYAGGAIDSIYQMHHHGDHMGTDIADWFVDKKNSIENWWEHSHHWWQ